MTVPASIRICWSFLVRSVCIWVEAVMSCPAIDDSVCVRVRTEHVTSQRDTPKGSKKPETSEGAVLHTTTRWHPGAV